MEILSKNIAREIVETQYNKQVEYIRPVQMSYQQLAQALSPGNIVFYGFIYFNPTQLFNKASVTGRQTYYTKLFNKITFHLHQISQATPIIQLFDSICSNTNGLAAVTNYDTALVSSTETTITQDLLAGFNFPLITFVGFQIRIK